MARDFIAQWRSLYPQRAVAVDAIVADARRNKVIYDVAGFPLHLAGKFNRRSIGNFPIQACDFQILRRALLNLINLSVMVTGTNHDSIMVECNTRDAKDIAQLVPHVMEEASREFLDGNKIRVDTARCDYPNHYYDKKGFKFWNEEICPVLKRLFGNRKEFAQKVAIG